MTRSLLLLFVLALTAPAYAGLTVVIAGKITKWDNGTDIPADKVVYIRLYGAKQGAAKTFLDSAVSADRLKFARPTASSTVVSCYIATSWVDQNADALVQPEEESLPSIEVCGKGIDPIVILRAAAPATPTIEAP